MVMFSENRYLNHISQIVLLLVLSLGTLKTFAADSIELKGETLMLGEALTLTVRGEKSIDELKAHEFGDLQNHFAIDTFDSRSDRLRLKFYPYQTGDFVFPALSLQNASLDERRIKVVKNPDVVIKWNEMPETVFFQQSLLQAVDIQLPSDKWRVIPETHLMTKSMREQWSLEVLNHLDAAELKRFEDNRYQFHTIFNYRGFVEPLQQVQTFIPQAHIKIRRPNGRYWHFYSAPKMIRLTSLPSFLPADALVAELKWQSSVPTVSLYQDVNEWRWELQAENVSAAYLKNLANGIVEQLSTVSSVNWLTPEITTQQMVIEQENESVVRQAMQLTIPFRPLQWVWQQPEIRLGYVDPNSQKWHIETLPAGWHLSLPQTIIWFVWVIGVAVLLWVLSRFWKVLQVLWLLRKMDQRCLNAQSVDGLLQGFFAGPFAASQRHNDKAISTMSCQQWLQSYAQSGTSFEALKQAEQLIALAEQGLYAPQVGESDFQLEHLKAQYLQWRQAQKLWPLFWRALKIH